MRNLILTITLAAMAAFVSAPVVAQQTENAPPPDINTICAATSCREGGFEVMIAVDAVKYQFPAVPVSKSPYTTQDGAILIFPGEALLFQFDGNSDHLGTPKFVRAYTASLPSKVDIDGALSPNPSDAGLPPIPEKDGRVDLAAFPPNSLLISYGQSVTKEQALMLMELNGTFAKTVKFDVTMFALTPGKAGYHQAYTSSCPLHATLGLFESWPNPIGPMVIDNFRFIPDSETMCK